MADKTSIAIEVEVQGVEQSIESVKDLKNALKAAKDEQIKMASAFGESSKEYLDATKKVSGLKDKVEDLNDSTKSLKGTGVEQLTQGFAQMKEGIMNLDFDKVKGGITAMKSGMGAFASSAKTALSGVKNALIATGIGAIVVALGLIVAYWDDIKGVITGVTEEQKKLNAASKENFENEKEKLTALNSQENTLKLQGKSEKEILNLKVKQTDEVIKAAEAQLEMTIQTQLAEKAAAERSKTILNSLINFISLPLTVLLRGIDGIGNVLGKNFGLMESFQKSITDIVLGSDKELEAKQAKELADQEKTLSDLKNQRAGLQLSINKIDTDAAKTASENATKAAEEAKKLRDEKIAAEIAAMKQIQDAYVANEQDEQKRLVKKAILEQQRRFEEINKTVTDETLKAELLKASEKTFRNEMSAIHQASLDKQKAAEEKAAADKKALDAKTLAETNAENIAAAELAVLKEGNELNDLINQLQVKRDIELQNKDLTASQKLLIDEKYAQDLHKLETDAEKAKQDEIVKIAEQGLQSAQNLSDIFFLFKKSKAEKGSKEETELARKQFNVNKALQIGMATIDGFKAITSILAQYPKFDGGIAMAAALVATGTASAATIAKIAATKFESGGGAPSAGGGGGGVPSIPPPPTIATPENNTNKTTSFDETGKNLNFQGTPTPTINVKASVGVDEITSKSNRVEVLENQSTF